MSSTFHYLLFRTFAHATEDREKVLRALAFAAGAKGTPRETALEGHFKNPILLLELELKSNPAIQAFWRRLAAEPGVLAALERQLDARMNDDMSYFLRLSKQDAYLGRLSLASDDDAIQVRAKVAAFPARPDVAREKMREFLARLRPVEAPAAPPGPGGDAAVAERGP